MEEEDRFPMLVALLGACPRELVLDILEDGTELDDEDC